MSVHFSSKTDNWYTPQYIIDDVCEAYGLGWFELDACASKENAKADIFYTKEDNGLTKNWSAYDSVWCNPPYGREIGKWIKKAYEESLKGAWVCMLIPSRTDTKWWHDYVMKGDITFIKGRIKFGGSKNSAPFPSALVVFDKNKMENN
ncbi:MAG: putative adenine-specific methylase [Prokaryotic dsDNA virus sp.]|nr:MAG: putative adenine-specific methylase [Prokaryotic dsDNA virus sp.]|tara:strand:- start:21561 stop:22004 length:444 start_codon:yes stop_codon:yes gene_type:complete